MSSRSLPGTGRQDGPLRPDWGDGWAVLRCDACDASWVGPIDEMCSWCREALERMQMDQARRVLTPPEVDADDISWRRQMDAWGQRLEVAVAADLISQAQADRAWRSVVADAA